MKKIILMAALVLSVAVANAASTSWKFVAGNVYGSDGKTKFTGDALVYCVGIGDGGTDVLVTTASLNNGVGGFSFSSDLFTADSTYDFYFTFTDSGKQFTSAVKENVKALGTGTASIQFGNMQSATQNASNWQVVPEPTSGLMLLLGVAGLALKRKRA